MESSILTSTKKALGLADNYTAFDLEIITFINSALVSLNQLGIGSSSDSLVIEDAGAVWEDLGISNNELGMVKVYIYLKVRMVFDPPPTSFVIDAMNKQIAEHEWRMSSHRETSTDTSYVTETEVIV